MDFSFFLALGVLSAWGLIVPVLATASFRAVYKRRLYALELQIAQTQEALLREIKRRAGQSRGGTQAQLDEIQTLLKTPKPDAPTEWDADSLLRG